MATKYTGRPLNELKTATLATYTGEEMEYFNKHINKPETNEPSVMGKIGLLAKAAMNNVSEKVQGVGSEITLAMIQQQIRDKKRAALNKELNISSLDVLRKNGEISQAEYEEALEELEA